MFTLISYSYLLNEFNNPIYSLFYVHLIHNQFYYNCILIYFVKVVSESPQLVLKLQALI